jgi:hypothetical protein
MRVISGRGQESPRAEPPRQSAIQSDELERLRIAISGNQRGAKQECISRAQGIVQHDSFSVKASRRRVRDFNPRRGGFVYLPNRAAQQRRELRPLPFLSGNGRDYFNAGHHPDCDFRIGCLPAPNLGSRGFLKKCRDQRRGVPESHQPLSRSSNNACKTPAPPGILMGL